MINVMVESPMWVNQLAKTKAGRRMLCRIVNGLIKRGADEEEIIDGVQQEAEEAPEW